MQELWRKDQL